MTGEITELLAFLNACLTEDDATARATTWEGSGNSLRWEEVASATLDFGGDEVYLGDRTIKEHVQRHQPARVLTDSEAKRALIADLLAEQHTVCTDHWYTCCAATKERDGGTCPRNDHNHLSDACTCGLTDRVIRRLQILARPYTDQTGYKETWRP